jgi:hypothetical protein
LFCHLVVSCLILPGLVCEGEEWLYSKPNPARMWMFRVLVWVLSHNCANWL